MYRSAGTCMSGFVVLGAIGIPGGVALLVYGRIMRGALVGVMGRATYELNQFGTNR